MLLVAESERRLIESSAMAAALCLALAAFLQGLTGFGFGLTAMGLLPLLLPVRDAQTMTTLVGVVVTAMNVYVARRHFVSTGVRPLLVGSCVGVPLGYQIRNLLPESSVRPWLGAALCAMVVWDAAARYVRRHSGKSDSVPTAASLSIGLFSGILTGAFNIGGPPLVAYVYSRPWSLQRVVAVLSVIFLTSGLVRLAVIVADSAVTLPLLQVAAISLIPVLAGIVLGQRLLPRVPQVLLRMSVSVVLFCLGLGFLLSGVASR